MTSSQKQFQISGEIPCGLIAILWPFVYFNCTLRTMHDVWMGDRSYKEAMSSGDLMVEGEPALLRNISSWLRPSVFATAPRAPMPEALMA